MALQCITTGLGFRFSELLRLYTGVGRACEGFVPALEAFVLKALNLHVETA